MSEAAAVSSAQNETASRVAYLESIRGLAAVQVLLLHFFSAFLPDLVFAPSAGAMIAPSIHRSPLYFLYDGYSAVYIFFTLSGYVLTRSFERHLARPDRLSSVLSQIFARVLRLGLPAISAVLVAAFVLSLFGRANVAAGGLSGSPWLASQWNTQASFVAVIRDGIFNALFLGYRDLPGVAFLAPWQQNVQQSLVVPLWTLSIEFYGSMIVLGLCWGARRSRMLWHLAMLMGVIFTIRSAYICFFVGHLLAGHGRAERPAPRRKLMPLLTLLSGVGLCVLAEFWQPQWLQDFGAVSTSWLFPAQFAAMQQKTFGAILVLIGLMDLGGARRLLAHRWLVGISRLSFPLYLIHWPILFGPSAALFVWLDGSFGTGFARIGAVAAGIAASLLASRLFWRVDHKALELSRAVRRANWTAPASMTEADMAPPLAPAVETDLLQMARLKLARERSA